MPRNPKNPKEYVRNSRSRSNEKLELLLEMLFKFHVSTKELILRRMGLATNSHYNYFRKIEQQDLIKKVPVYSIRSKHVYMLTNLGKQIAYEKLNEAAEYSTDPNKINHSFLRHDLAVQKAVIDRLSPNTKFTSERHLPKLSLGEKKKPDACLEDEGKKTVLEVELTPKSDVRIYRAFTALADAILNNHYQEVIYIFPTDAIKKYYLERFNKILWPTYHQNEKGLWVSHGANFAPDEHGDLRAKFIFVADNHLLEDI